MIFTFFLLLSLEFDDKNSRRFFVYCFKDLFRLFAGDAVLLEIKEFSRMEREISDGFQVVERLSINGRAQRINGGFPGKFENRVKSLNSEFQ